MGVGIWGRGGSLEGMECWVYRGWEFGEGVWVGSLGRD